MTAVDLHLHLLPGIDDGAPDEATALAHAERMLADGIRTATVTPHVGSPDFDVDPLTIPERTRLLQAAIDREGLGLTLHPGGEVHPEGAGNLTAAQLDAIAHGPRDARWVLVEVPFTGIDDAFLDGLGAVNRRGFGVVIAHPERAVGLLTDGGLDRLRPVLEAGAVLQVNACSLMGRHGADVKDAARRLMRNRSAYIIASDGHPGHRDHTLADGATAAAADGASATHIAHLTRDNPGLLLRHGLPCVRRGPRPHSGISGTAIARARAAARRLTPTGRHLR